MQGSGGVLSPNASKLFRIRKTVATMLKKRGYVVPEKMLHMTADDFKAEFVAGDEPNLERMSMLLFKETNELDRIYVFFPEGDLALPQIKVCVGRFVKSAPIAPWGRRCAGCGTNPPRIPCAAT